MKKLFLLLLFCFALCGCSPSENSDAGDKEYTVEEFSDIYWGISNYDNEQFSKLTNEEKYGGKTNEIEMAEFARPIHAKFQKEKMGDYKIKYDTPFNIRGKIRIGSVVKDDYGTCCELWPLDKDSNAVFITLWMVDEMNDLKDDSVVVVQAEFKENLAGTAVIMGNGKIISK